jgi:hypothetical protein
VDAAADSMELTIDCGDELKTCEWHIIVVSALIHDSSVIVKINLYNVVVMLAMVYHQQVGSLG